MKKSSLLILALLAILAACGSDRDDDRYNAANDTGPRIAGTCEYTLSSKADPIFKPEAEPPAHQHDVFGPEHFDNATHYLSLQGTATRCKQPDDLSAWWRPMASWGGVPLRPPPKLVIYYEITSPETAEQVRPWPQDFADVSRRPTFRCGDGDWSKAAPTRCGEDTLQIRMEYEQCLDTTNDAVEENTRLPRDGKCPAPYSLMIPKIQSTGTYRLPKAEGPLKVAGNTGMMDASSMHEDFLNGWREEALRHKVALCLRQTGQREDRPEECRTSDRDGG